MLTLHRRLLALRRSRKALSIGTISEVEADDGLLRYERRHDDERLLIALNLTAERRRIASPRGARIQGALISTLSDRPYDGTLAPNEGLVLELTGV